MFRLAVDTPVSLQLAGYEQGYPAGSFLWIVNKIYFQYFSLIIFLVSAATMVVVSYLTRKPDYGRIGGLTFGTLSEVDRSETRNSWGALDVITSLGVLAAITAAYVYFSG
jgi:SSS family solute:Na+ symporter